MEDLIDSEIVADLTLHVEAISRHVPLRLLRPPASPAPHPYRTRL